MSGPLRVDVIGVGYLGRIHARIYAQMAEVELVGVVDIDGATAREIATECHCSAFTDPLALRDRVDAVSIAVPTSAHEEVALPYLDAGVHMLIEKPLATSVEDCRRRRKATGERLDLCGIGTGRIITNRADHIDCRPAG